MAFLDTWLKFCLLGVTAVCLVLTIIIFRFFLRKRRENQQDIFPAIIMSQVAFLAWSAIPYHHIIDICDFKAEVKQWAADFETRKQKISSSPQFDASRWGQFSVKTFLFVILFLVSLSLLYLRLLIDMQRSLETLHAKRRQRYSRATGNEENNSLEDLPAKRKKVSFQIPEPEPHKILVDLERLHEIGFAMLPSKRKAILAVACMVLSILLLPPQFQHSFPLVFVKVKEIFITSDHLVAAIAMFILWNMAYNFGQGFKDSAGTLGVRLAVCQFIQAYGIFLMIISSLALLQSNDTLKLYVYKVYFPGGRNKKWKSFYDIHVPNENIILGIFGENMMKYTNLILNNEQDKLKASQNIDRIVDVFARVLGDCVSVLLFSTLVVVPSALGWICSN